jgi:LPXTG-motif cell wall-anchored protein
MKKLFYLLTVMLIAAGISVAQSTSNDQGSSTSGSAASSSSSTDQATPSTSSDQGTQGATTSDQSATGAASTGAQDQGAKAGNLPQTASPLPLLGLLGMGSLAAGVLTRRKNR